MAASPSSAVVGGSICETLTGEGLLGVRKSPVPFQCVGKVHNSYLDICNPGKSLFVPLNVTSGPTFSLELFSVLLTQCLHYETQPFAESPLVPF